MLTVFLQLTKYNKEGNVDERQNCLNVVWQKDRVPKTAPLFKAFATFSQTLWKKHWFQKQPMSIRSLFVLQSLNTPSYNPRAAKGEPFHKTPGLHVLLILQGPTITIGNFEFSLCCLLRPLRTCTVWNSFSTTTVNQNWVAVLWCQEACVLGMCYKDPPSRFWGNTPNTAQEPTLQHMETCLHVSARAHPSFFWALSASPSYPIIRSIVQELRPEPEPCNPLEFCYKKCRRTPSSEEPSELKAWTTGTVSRPNHNLTEQTCGHPALGSSIQSSSLRWLGSVGWCSM